VPLLICLGFKDRIVTLFPSWYIEIGDVIAFGMLISF